ncbi:MAG: hypothetical protein LBP22_10665 [Deltaproteobacteria bacterium]|nr:hypothetical protein [Deltaproteobacteria bacterium]
MIFCLNLVMRKGPGSIKDVQAYYRKREPRLGYHFNLFILNKYGRMRMGATIETKKLPQINLCMLFGEKSRLPVYQTSYCGSLGDVTTLEATLMEFKAMAGKKEISLVMDKGFYSKKMLIRY